MFKIGTTVYHYGGGKHTHGKGVIVGYNEQLANSYLQEKFKDAVAIAEKLPNEIGLAAIVQSTYSKDIYPYVVKFDSGYQDVYGEDSLTLEYDPDYFIKQ